MPKHVVIIGNGVAGVTAARFIRKLSDFRITLVSEESDYFFSRPALMYLYMGHMREKDVKPYEDWFWDKNRIGRIRDYVEHIDTDTRRLTLREEASLEYDVLILATGARPRFFGWPGEDLDGVQGLVSLQDLEGLTARTERMRHAVVVGGGLIGIEMAEMLHTRGIGVTFLVREPSYFSRVLPEEESALINDEIREHGIDLRLETELAEILGDDEGRVRGVVTSAGDEIACEFVGATIGVTPRIEMVERTAVETNRGILVDRFFRTNIPDVYAVGDCNEFREEGIGHRKVDLLWYTGREHGKTVAQTICGYPTPYDRGVFFNSAKFFSVEYQTYGDVTPERAEGVETLVWTDRATKRVVRIDYEREGGRVVGFNTLGVRLRHDVCERWLLDGQTVRYVLAHLREASFEPEFFRRFEGHLADAYNARHPDQRVTLEQPQRGFFGRLLRAS